MNRVDIIINYITTYLGIEVYAKNELIIIITKEREIKNQALLNSSTIEKKRNIE